MDETSRQLINMVSEWLIERGFDGLFNEAGNCGCDLGDLMPCGCPSPTCEAGYKVQCPKDCGCHDYHIAAHQRVE